MVTCIYIYILYKCLYIMLRGCLVCVILKDAIVSCVMESVYMTCIYVYIYSWPLGILICQKLNFKVSSSRCRGQWSLQGEVGEGSGCPAAFCGMQAC